MRLEGDGGSLDLVVIGFEASDESALERDDDSWVSVAATATAVGSKPVEIELSFTLGEARDLASWLRHVARSVSSGSAAPGSFHTVEPEFAAEASTKGAGHVVLLFYLYDPRSPFQPNPEIAFHAKSVEIQADKLLLDRWADEWDASLTGL